MGLAFDNDVPGSLLLDETPASVYREYAPAAALTPYLVCAWTLEINADDPPHRQRVLPDGCSDIIWVGHAPPIVVGAMTRSVLSTPSAGATLVGLRFRPEAGARVLGIRAEELTDRQARLDQVWHPSTVNELSERLLETRTSAERAAVAQSVVASRRDHIGAVDRVVQHALSLVAAPGHGRIDRVAREVGISERQLRRRFLDSIGYSPKLFQRVLRFQKLLAITHARPSARLGDVALLAGYADQAHMTRDVGEFSGVPPSALLGHAVSALTLSELIGDT